MQQTSKLVVVLLVAVLAMQLWTFNRQSQLAQELQVLAASRNQSDMRIRNDLDALQRRLSEMAEADRWVVVNRAEVAPVGSCGTAQVQVDWTLQEWGEGTTSRLLYRASADQPWQEATVERRGIGQNYTATLPIIGGKPYLEVGWDVSHAPNTGRKSQEARAGSMAVEASPLSGLQYQIVAESPSMSRSTGVKTVSLSSQFVIPVKIGVDVERDGRYIVDLYTDPNRGPCAQLESVEIRAYSGNEVVETRPMTREQDDRLRAEWQSDQALHRLELLIQHSGGVETLVIPL